MSTATEPRTRAGLAPLLAVSGLLGIVVAVGLAAATGGRDATGVLPDAGVVTTYGLTVVRVITELGCALSIAHANAPKSWTMPPPMTNTTDALVAPF